MPSRQSAEFARVHKASGQVVGPPQFGETLLEPLHLAAKSVDVVLFVVVDREDGEEAAGGEGVEPDQTDGAGVANQHHEQDAGASRDPEGGQLAEGKPIAMDRVPGVEVVQDRLAILGTKLAKVTAQSGRFGILAINALIELNVDDPA